MKPLMVGAMIYYRFYSLDKQGHVVGVQECEAVDDIAALEAAQKLCGAHPMEIWEGTRRVAQLDIEGNAPEDGNAPEAAR